MDQKPLAIAVAALIKDDKILLIKRIRGDYIGLLALLGGKIHLNEHVAEAALREIKEESGIDAEFIAHKGIVSELLIKDGSIVNHFLIHVTKLRPLSTEITQKEEGILEWYDLEQLEELKEHIIPSDYLMIQHMILGQSKGYYECVLEKDGFQYSLRKFEEGHQ